AAAARDTPTSRRARRRAPLPSARSARRRRRGPAARADREDPRRPRRRTRSTPLPRSPRAGPARAVARASAAARAGPRGHDRVAVAVAGVDVDRELLRLEAQTRRPELARELQAQAVPPLAEGAVLRLGHDLALARGDQLHLRLARDAEAER